MACMFYKKIQRWKQFLECINKECRVLVKQAKKHRNRVAKINEA